MIDTSGVDLTKIAIRCQVEPGKWDSKTIQELYHLKSAGTVAEWFQLKVIRQVFDRIGLAEAEEINEEHLKRMIVFLEGIGVTIIKMK